MNSLFYGPQNVNSMVKYAVVWYGMVWYADRYGMWYSIMWYGMVYGIVRCGMVYGMLWNGIVLYAVVWLWCDVVPVLS